MKIIGKSIVGIFFLGFILIGCKNEVKEDVLKTEKLEFAGELPDMSLYNLPAEWTNQDGENVHLADLRGDIVVAVMIYTNCQAACPRLVADMRHISQRLSDEAREQTKFVFFSIDPETDTPEKMKQFAIDNEMNNESWIFLRGSEEDTREFAATLAVSYKRISPIDFSHSNIISVFDQNGVLDFQEEGLDKDGTAVVEAVEALKIEG